MCFAGGRTSGARKQLLCTASAVSIADSWRTCGDCKHIDAPLAIWDLAALNESAFCIPCVHPADFEHAVTRQLRIYVYPLPARYHASILHQITKDEFTKTNGCDFGITACKETAWIHGYSWKRQFASEVAILLKFLASPSRVSDPADANLFVVPYLVKSETAIKGCHDGMCGNELKEQVFHDLPFYNESTQARHLFLATGGLKGLPREIAVQPLAVTLGPQAQIPGLSGLQLYHGHIVVPAFTLPRTHASIHKHARATTFYFAGANVNFWRHLVISELQDYSRAHPGSVLLHLNATSDGIGRNCPATPQDMADGMEKSIFCPVLPGDMPHGQRLFNVIMHGCIPVVLAFPTTWGGLGSISWWAEDGPPWQWCVPGVAFLPPEEQIPWTEFVIQVPVSHALHKGFIAEALRLGSPRIEKLQQQLSQASSRLAYDYTGLNPDAFSIAIRQVAHFLNLTDQIRGESSPEVSCISAPNVPNGRVCSRIPTEAWQQRCKMTRGQFGKVLCLTRPLDGKVHGIKQTLAAPTSDAWNIAAVTWLPMDEPSSTSRCSALVYRTLAWAEKWASTLSTGSSRSVVVDLTILLTKCTNRSAEIATYSCKVKTRTFGNATIDRKSKSLLKGRLLCAGVGSLYYHKVSADSHPTRVWTSVLEHAHATMLAPERSDWLLLVPRCDGGAEAPKQVKPLWPPMRAFLSYRPEQLFPLSEISLCGVWWSLVGSDCPGVIPPETPKEDLKQFAFAALIVPGSVLRLVPVPRWNFLRYVEVDASFKEFGVSSNADIVAFFFMLMYTTAARAKNGEGLFNEYMLEPI